MFNLTTKRAADESRSPAQPTVVAHACLTDSAERPPVSGIYEWADVIVGKSEVAQKWADAFAEPTASESLNW